MHTPHASRPQSSLEKRFGDGCRFLAFPSWHFVVPAVEDLIAERCLLFPVGTWAEQLGVVLWAVGR